MEMLAPTLTALLTQLPVILVLLAGFILSLIHWQQHPRVSLLTAIAVVGFLAIMLIQTFLNVWLPITLYQQDWDASQIGIIFTMNSVISSLASAVLWGLLLIAMFGWRNELRETAGNGTPSLISSDDQHQ